MRWLALTLVVVVSGGVLAVRASDGPDLGCPGPHSTAFREASSGHRTPHEALGDLLPDADRVTEEPDDAKGFETVTFRAYDPAGELMSRVVVEDGAAGWTAARVDTCG
ncbi:hypothetical protein [Nocardioides sediminis]|uniref:hypothetical protein n=1 Tax=Nocardioides sediminis TaxID=433648 RepID=UPI000D2F6DFC|nr:hypothetical protein [Nocardioides sediminis]